MNRPVFLPSAHCIYNEKAAITLPFKRGQGRSRTATISRVIPFVKLVAVFLAVGLSGTALRGRSSAQRTQDDLAGVLSRAAQYVADYEEKQLGNLLASEDYLQDVELRGNQRFAAGYRHQQRRTQSDFLILKVGAERVALRRVTRLDGKKIDGSEESFFELDNSPEGRRRQIDAIRKESTQYNIGPILRQINVPTFALAVARASESKRFAFVREDTRRIDGVETWEIRFKEQRSPTLTHGLKGESLLSTGALWVEPQTGRILRTEFAVENPFSDPPVKGRITVTYRPNKNLGMLVPTEMNEHYESGSALVDCFARYSDFRAFSVDVNSVIEAPSSR